jgi:hypothetical protein
MVTFNVGTVNTSTLKGSMTKRPFTCSWYLPVTASGLSAKSTTAVPYLLKSTFPSAIFSSLKSLLQMEQRLNSTELM